MLIIMGTMKKRVLGICLICGLFCGCYHYYQPEELFVTPIREPNYASQGNIAEGVMWAVVAVGEGILHLGTVGLPFTCAGIIVETDGKRPLPGALVMVRSLRSGKMVMATTQNDGSFVLRLKKWGAGPPDVQITALAKMHGRAVTIAGREYCQNLTMELPVLSDKEWHAFRDKYVNPVITAAKGPMWDVDAQSREELESFAKVLY